MTPAARSTLTTVGVLLLFLAALLTLLMVWP